MERKRRFDSTALEYAYNRYVGDDPTKAAHFEVELANADIAQKIHDLRISAGLTQRELAERVGTTSSVISRLEAADYAGHSLSMLRRIALAVENRVEIRFVPLGNALPPS